MKRLFTTRTNILRLIALFAAAAFALPSIASAALIADFNPDPLFSESNFMPGTAASGEVTITNGYESIQEVYVEAVNIFDPDNLSEEMRLRILEGVSVLYEDSFRDFLEGGRQPLSNINPQGSKTYTFEITFLSNASNDSQGATLGFDMCVGFSGGNFQCGDTVVSPPIGGPGGPTNIPGGGGGGGQFVQLEIFNENALVLNPGTPVANPDGSVLITWNTNRLATSKVVYGLASGSYVLDINHPNYGYPFGTDEILTKTVNHSVPLGELIQGETYVYRVVSRASPATVSREHFFTLASAIGESPDSTGSVLGAATSFEAGETDESLAEESELNLLTAAALFGFEIPGLECILWAFVIFFIILALIWLLFRNGEKTLKDELKVLIPSLLFASILLILLSYTCPILPLWIIAIAYVIYRKISSEKEKSTIPKTQ